MRTTVKGKPAIVDTACKDFNDLSGLPRPPLIRAMAHKPSVKDQSTVWSFGGFACRVHYALHSDYGATLDDLHEAVTIFEDTTRVARRVLGLAHPITEWIEDGLRDAQGALRARETPSPPGNA